MELFHRIRRRRGFAITREGEASVHDIVQLAWEQRDAKFTNLRFLGRLFDDILERQANRVRGDDELTIITAEDIPSLGMERATRRVKPGWDSISSNVTEPPRDDSIEKILAELDSLIGLNAVKQRVRSLVDYYSVQQRRQAEGLTTTTISLHLAFVGSPGTGKTTVARLMGRLYKCLGLLARGHTVETDRTEFIGAYAGQTALKSNETVEQALHGVLFIDEAYTLSGDEAIGVLLKRMEDERGRLAIIAAGYSKEMEAFFEANSGLRSRFTQTITFDDYEPSELLAILERFCEVEGYVLTAEARACAREQLEWAYRQRTPQFGNGRLVRTMFEQAVERQAQRLARDAGAPLSELIAADIPELTLPPVRPDELLKITEVPPKDTIEQILSELDDMIGLDEVKARIRSLINLVKLEKQRREQGLSTTSMSLHLMFTGPPGTGKKTVARFIGRIYRALGLLDRGHLVETDRSGLVAEWLGQTAPKVHRTVERALNGVLFIDEAYALKHEHRDSYGDEAVAALVKRMEDHRKNLAVVLAGYSHAMEKFMDANAGLRSRISQTIEFRDYNPAELLAIFERFCKTDNYVLSPEARSRALKQLEWVHAQRNPQFGNGRMVRTMFEQAVERHAQRLAEDPSAVMSHLTASDIPTLVLPPLRSEEMLKVTDPPANDSIENILADLDRMVGLNEVKERIRSIINLVKVEQQRAAQGIAGTPMTLHLMFTGRPGTGKTTVARFIGRIYRALGLLHRGHVVETDRAGLVAEWTGQTGPKVNRTVDRALHGVLFIDEAYALRQSGNDSFGDEAVAALVKRMEDDREPLAVVLVGYTAEMKAFLTFNSGLRSRFQGAIDFPDYSVDEMLEIFDRFCDSRFRMTESARQKLRLRFDEARLQQDASLGNGRLVRQMFEMALQHQANRLADAVDASDLSLLEEVDIPDTLPGQKKHLMVDEEERRAVAFHEVGHALVGFLLPGCRQVERMAILPYSERDLGYTSYKVDEGRQSRKADEIRNQIASCLEGMSAEQVVYGYLRNGAGSDLRQATSLAEAYVKHYGMSRLGPLAARTVGPAAAQQIDEEIQHVMNTAHRVALAILTANRTVLQDAASALLAAEVMEGDELRRHLAAGRLPESVHEWMRTGEFA